MPVYDLSYRRGRGPLRAGPRFLPVYRDCLAYAWRNRWMKFLFFLCFAPALSAIVILSQVYQDVQDAGGTSFAAAILLDRMQQLMQLENYSRFFEFTWLFVMLLATGAGAGLISEDRKANALEIYFSRAMNRSDYLLGKALGMVTVIWIGAALPWILFWIFDVGLSPATDRWNETLHYPFVFALNGLAIAIPTSLIVLAISSLGRGSRDAAAYWIAFAYFTRLVAALVTRVVWRDPRAGITGYYQLLTSVRIAIFGVNYDHPTLPPVSSALATLCMYSFLAIYVLVVRTRPTEVVS
ncbi:MAG: ABC transporter permease subunit [Planctomycetes bacterium]|nr:ABC transporter permease subunit [Planctomycetota bacterium]MCB9890847.1 ABC transporter permease subunit [Planctomycetota bacterium]